MDGQAITNAVEAIKKSVEVEDRFTISCIDGVDVPIVVDLNGSVRVAQDIVNHLDSRDSGPLRRSGQRELHDLESFIAFVNRYKDDSAVVYASAGETAVIAVFDENPKGAGVTAWRGDRARYSCPLARRWKLWTGASEKAFTPEQFGDFVEENATDLAPSKDGSPSPAALIEMARDLRVHTSAKYERKINPTTGESSLVAAEEHGSHSTKIPRSFFIVVPVFEGGSAYRLECLVRFSMVGGRPTFAFIVHQADQALEDAFGEVKKVVAEKCSIPVFAGEP